MSATYRPPETDAAGLAAVAAEAITRAAADLLKQDSATAATDAELVAAVAAAAATLTAAIGLKQDASSAATDAEVAAAVGALNAAVAALDVRLDSVESDSLIGLPSKVAAATPKANRPLYSPKNPEWHSATAMGLDADDDRIAVQAAIHWVAAAFGSKGGEVELLSENYLLSTSGGTVTLPYDDGSVAAGYGAALAAESQTTMPYCLYLAPGVKLISRNERQVTRFVGNWTYGTSPVDTSQPICIKMGVSFGSVQYSGAIEGVTFANYMIPVIGVGAFAQFKWRGVRFLNCATGPVMQTCERCEYENLQFDGTPAGIVHGGWWTQRNNSYAAAYLVSDYHTGFSDKNRIAGTFDYINFKGHSATENALDACFDTYFFKTANSTTGAAYTSAPAIGFTGGGGSGATATASINAHTGKITAISVTAGGSGYTTAPTVTFTGGGGTGATATAIISGDAVTGVAIGRASAPIGADPGGQINLAPYKGICGSAITFHSRYGRYNFNNSISKDGPWFVFGASRFALNQGRGWQNEAGSLYGERIGYSDPANFGAAKIMGETGYTDPYHSTRPPASIYGVGGVLNDFAGINLNPVAAATPIDVGSDTTVRQLYYLPTHVLAAPAYGRGVHIGNLKPGNTANPDPLALDWYEEGSFAPTIAGTTSAGSHIGGGTSAGVFQRRGNRVEFSLVAVQTSHTGTGNIRIGGLPYAGAAIGALSMCVVYPAAGMAFTGPALAAYVESGASTMLVRQISTAGAGTGVPLPAGAMTLYVTGSYQV